MNANEKPSTNYTGFTICGNLTRDLEVNPDHPNIATIHLACNDAPDHVSYFDIAYNGEARIAEFGPLLKKGAFVKVKGAIRQDRWETADGSKRSKIVFSATSVEHFGAAK